MIRTQKIWLFSLVLSFTLVLVITYGDAILCRINYLPFLDTVTFQKKCQVADVVSNLDLNHDGISDSLDLVNGARQEVARRTRYDSSYYEGGYPPGGRGTDTDLIWRAFSAAGYNLKNLVDADIQAAPYVYGFSDEKPDPNIDFRRVKNLDIFLQRHAIILTREVRPGDANNLAQWQPGDIVVFGPPSDHIAIISDRRRTDGVPLVIHNADPWATEGDYLLRWSSRIVRHFRFVI